MKELLLQLSQYNLWANQQLLDVINDLPETAVEQELPGSFSSLKKTVLHLWDAEAVWWQRIRLQERVVFPSAQFDGSMKEASAQFLQQNKSWIDWIQDSPEHSFLHEFIYQNTKREQFKQPVFKVLTHVFNHGTYHRGQLVTMLREVGVEKIPGTDYILWSRRK